MTVSAATVHEYRVLWYETKAARSVINSGSPARPLPRAKPTRREVFHVRARTVDTARALARDYVKKRLNARQQLLAVNFTAKAFEIIVYTSEKKEN